MAVPEEPHPPKLPFPIFRISSKVERYMLYDINTVTWLRKAHHILGVLVGTLPQAPQQNIFLGLPLELMQEEARLLVEKGIAYIVNDLEWHERGLALNEKETFMQYLAKGGKRAAEAAHKKKVESTEKAMGKLRLSSTPEREPIRDASDFQTPIASVENDEPFFSSLQEPSLKSTPQLTTPNMDTMAIISTTSYPPLSEPRDIAYGQLPKVRASPYALFKHMHARGYFLSPGLRFGCQFMAYPGDPLRFHSHFLTVGADWDEELDLMDIVGGGRLGTGVKKGFLIGGVQPEDAKGEQASRDEKLRTFCIEWAGM